MKKRRTRRERKAARSAWPCARYNFLTLCTTSSGYGQTKSPEQFGKVDFPNSCATAVQATVQRGVAMLNSFGYAETEKVDIAGQGDPRPELAKARTFLTAN